jgi:hypothetical protein
VREVSSLGTYKQLEVLRTQQIEPYFINENALRLLIGHCPLLKRIELVGSGSSGAEDFFGKLRSQLLLQNFDLKFKLIDRDVLADLKNYALFD